MMWLSFQVQSHLYIELVNMLIYNEDAKSIAYSCQTEVEVRWLHMNYKWHEKSFWRSEHTVGMPCVCFMDSVNKGLPTEMQHIQQIDRILRHAANKQVPHKARQIKAGKVNMTVNTSSCTHLYGLSYVLLLPGAFCTNKIVMHLRLKKKNKANIVVKIHNVRELRPTKARTKSRAQRQTCREKNH